MCCCKCDSTGKHNVFHHSYPWLKVWFVVSARRNWRWRWVLLMVNCDWSPTWGERWGRGWGSCSLHHAIGDDLFDSIDCSWRKKEIRKTSADSCNVKKQQHSIQSLSKFSTDCQQALSSALGRADTEADHCENRNKAVLIYKPSSI